MMFAKVSSRGTCTSLTCGRLQGDVTEMGVKVLKAYGRNYQKPGQIEFDNGFQKQCHNPKRSRDIWGLQAGAKGKGAEFHMSNPVDKVSLEDADLVLTVD